MIDPLGRTISYLRVSVTDRCDFRCTYCMGDDMNFLPRRDLLSLEELERLCSAFIARGIRKIRLTGGEPLLRRGITGLVRSLGRHLNGGGLDELTMTTNASQLEKYAAELADCGIRRINVSIDTLDADRFSEITRGGSLEQVIVGLDAATAAGLAIKINAVALKGFNEDQFSGMLAWCGDKGYDITFIETMPLGDIGGDRADNYLPAGEVRRILENDWTLNACDHNSGGPSRYWQVAETGKLAGFISPLSHNFCATCNRVRVTCTGKLFMCLGQDEDADLRSPLRASEDDRALLAAIDEAIGRKPKSHDFVIDSGNGGPALSRHMSMTGG